MGIMESVLIDVRQETGIKGSSLFEPSRTTAWREKMLRLFGSINDETFQRPVELPFSSDVKKAEL